MMWPSLLHLVLHTYPAIATYGFLLIPRVTRLPALGLVIHMTLDALDCVST